MLGSGPRVLSRPVAGLILTLWALATLVPAVSAAPAPTARRSVEATRPSARAARIPAAEAPIIDGDLSDPVWAKAVVIDRLVQAEPDNGAPISERTVLRIAYDENNLYFAIYAYDREPDKIVATIKSRDGTMPKDDFIRIALDPYMTRRDAYAFEMNALGGRVDALIQNNSDFLPNWNTIWQGKSRFVADGWTAEIAIPFRDLSFDPARTEWGFDFVRQIKRKSERAHWGPPPANIINFDISYAGTLTGLSGMTQGAGLDVQLYAASRYKHDGMGVEDNDVTFQPSGNLYYRLTPSLTGTLTVNTDFSDAPLDKRQVNTTRFGLFTAETRQFFLQDAASFEFGGHEYAKGLENGKPFFSRNIGLVNGAPVGIVAGGKLSGDFEGVNLGMLTAQTAGTDTGDGQILSVARMTVPVFAESKFGVVLTNGDPTGSTDNSVAGTDFQYRDTDFLGSGKQLQGDAHYEESFSNVQGQDHAMGASLLFLNEPWGGDVHFKRIGANYVPALGFSNRTGINEYRIATTYRERFQNSFFRWAEAGTGTVVVTGLDGRLQSRDDRHVGQFFTEDGDRFQLTYHEITENVRTPFFLPNKTPVTPGHYTWAFFSPRFETSQARPLSVIWDSECCGFYNGNYVKSDFSIDYRPNETWEFILQHVMTLIDLPHAGVNIHIGSFDVATNFTPDMQLRTQVQYDNITKRFQLLARYRWEYEPGSELFLSIGETSGIVGPFFGPQYQPNNTQALIRIGHTFQF